MQIKERLQGIRETIFKSTSDEFVVWLPFKASDDLGGKNQSWLLIITNNIHGVLTTCQHHIQCFIGTEMFILCMNPNPLEGTIFIFRYQMWKLRFGRFFCSGQCMKKQTICSPFKSLREVLLRILQFSWPNLDTWKLCPFIYYILRRRREIGVTCKMPCGWYVQKYCISPVCCSSCWHISMS